MITDELAAFAVRSGIPCRITMLSRTRPVEHAALVEAMGTDYASTVVARWWNATHGGTTGTKISDQMVTGHRRGECSTCR